MFQTDYEYYPDDLPDYPGDPKNELIYACQCHMKDIVNMLYSDNPLDRHELEETLEEVCDLLSVSMPDGPIRVQRKSISNYFSTLDTKSLYVTTKTL